MGTSECRPFRGPPGNQGKVSRGVSQGTGTLNPMGLGLGAQCLLTWLSRHLGMADPVTAP
eukprot:15331459-Ditylum_brightwellii.AAC.1